MPNDPTRVEIITGRERRRRCSAERELAWAEETMHPGTTVSAVARQRGIPPSLLFRWGPLMSQGGQVAVKADGVVAASRARGLEGHVREPEHLPGRKTMVRDPVHGDHLVQVHPLIWCSWMERMVTELHIRRSSLEV